jgi:hypothetical protein
MTFRYVRDPLFVLCTVLYLTNCWLLKPNLPASELVFRNYFDDLLLVPCLLPILLLAHGCLALRSDDAYPTAREVVIHLVVWSVCFELIGPMLHYSAVGDPLDVAAYCLGGIASLGIWARRSRPPFSHRALLFAQVESAAIRHHLRGALTVVRPPVKR